MTHLPPLAERMRPQKLSDYIGQSHLLGENGILKEILKSKKIPSFILWGPPGTGKTTLANLISKELSFQFYPLSAASAGAPEIRKVLDVAKKYQNVLLFIDEIHRLNKSQQDILLPNIEKGDIKLIGATTENPSFEINFALLSRCQIFILNPLSEENLKSILISSIKSDPVLNQYLIHIKEYESLFIHSGGDARKILNILELIVESSNSKEILITNELVSFYIQKKFNNYDKTGDQHYDIISAFIKSIRGSDPNAALYWLVRMTDSGEDPKFIARRLLILASEDIGNANPTALILANNCFQAVQVIGYPECKLILSQTTIYLACSEKSNSSTIALQNAQNLLEKNGLKSVPMHLRNGSTLLMKKLGYGKNYQYPHNFENNFVPEEYLPEDFSGIKLFNPGENSRENALRSFLKKRWGKNMIIKKIKT